MGSADIIQPDGVSPSTQFTIINTAADREFVINGTGFTYGPNNVPTGGIITSINEQEYSTHAPLADFTGLSVGADVWYSVLVAYAAGDQGPFNTLTASWAFIFNDSSGPDVLVGGQQNDRLIATGGDDTLDGEFGRDLADYSSATGPINVELAAGTVTGDSVDTDTLKSVEFITGTNFADTYDASGFSALSTNSGSTVTFDVNGTFNGFEGLGGNDIITGNGDTRVSYLNATSGVTVTLGPNGSGTATGDASVGTDTFISGVFRVRGSNFVDTLTGSNNSAFTVEQFEGRGGNDVINGGGGFDRSIYANEDAAIFVHLADGQVVGGVNTGTDTLTSVEGIIGTDFSDTYDATSFSGSSTNAGSNGTFNEFEGRGGNDTIIGNGNRGCPRFC
jgi:RTX calcium-binding nonapeptide repeat (4 copies)